jgi:hypothetical protein
MERQNGKMIIGDVLNHKNLSEKALKGLLMGFVTGATRVDLHTDEIEVCGGPLPQSMHSVKDVLDIDTVEEFIAHLENDYEVYANEEDGKLIFGILGGTL